MYLMSFDQFNVFLLNKNIDLQKKNIDPRLLICGKKLTKHIN